MTSNPSYKQPPVPADRTRSERERDETRERRRDREWRIAATQMAAPSTRRWRRAGTFTS